MLVVYRSEHEVIVTDVKNESAMLKEYFDEAGENVEDYDRDLTEVVRISSKVKVDIH